MVYGQEVGQNPSRAEHAELHRRLAVAEAALHVHRQQADNAAEDRSRRIVESAVDYAIIATDLDGTITDWNAGAARLFGWSAGQMLGQPLGAIFAAEDGTARLGGSATAALLMVGDACDHWHHRADGSKFFASGRLTSLTDSAGTPIGYLKILRDSTSEEEARRELQISQERLQFALDASALVGTWDLDVDSGIVHADARFAALYGVETELALKGLPLSAYVAGIHPDDRDRVAAGIGRTIAEGGSFEDEYRTIDGQGELHWVLARGHCILDANGRAERFPGAVVETTSERRRTARQAALLKLGDDILVGSDPVDSTMRAVRILGETMHLARSGYATVDPTETRAHIAGEWSRGGVTPLEREYDIAGFGEAMLGELRSGQIVIDDVRESAITRPGLAAWEAIGVRSVISMTVVENGRLRAILFLHDDRPRCWKEEDIVFVREVLNRAWAFSQRRRAEQALAHAETRLRLAQEAADLGTFDYDVATDTLLFDQRSRTAFGITDDAPVTMEGTFLQSLHPADRDITLAELRRILSEAKEGSFDCTFRAIGRDDATMRWIHSRGQTVVDNGAVVRLVGAVRDISQEHDSQERQKLLARELKHRVKNTLAMVNALANQTLRRAADPQQGLAAFTARLIALSKAHDILTQTTWDSASIGVIVAQSLSGHQPYGDQRIVWDGPDVRLNAKQSLALALALHELATNALKYGAMSNDDGRIDVIWKIVRESQETLLHVEWRESAGPKVRPPTARGFGSLLIEQALALEFGGSVRLSYEETGLLCHIIAPMMVDGERATAF